jgi:hypothetical protein
MEALVTVVAGVHPRNAKRAKGVVLRGASADLAATVVVEQMPGRDAGVAQAQRSHAEQGDSKQFFHGLRFLEKPGRTAPATILVAGARP